MTLLRWINRWTMLAAALVLAQATVTVPPLWRFVAARAAAAVNPPGVAFDRRSGQDLVASRIARVDRSAYATAAVRVEPLGADRAEVHFTLRGVGTKLQFPTLRLHIWGAEGVPQRDLYVGPADYIHAPREAEGRGPFDAECSVRLTLRRGETHVAVAPDVPDASQAWTRLPASLL